MTDLSAKQALELVYPAGIPSPPCLSKTLANPKARMALSHLLAQIVLASGATGVSGLANNGIPWAASCAQRLSLPMVYVRGSNKAHGLKRRVEGTIDTSLSYALIFDKVRDAQDVILMISAMEQEKAKVTGCFAVVAVDGVIDELAEDGITLKTLI